MILSLFVKLNTLLVVAKPLSGVVVLLVALEKSNSFRSQEWDWLR